MAATIYSLCTLTALLCAVLLLRAYRESRTRLLLWSGLSFTAWAVNHALVFTDLVVVPGIDLSLLRAVAALIAVSLLL